MKPNSPQRFLVCGWPVEVQGAPYRGEDYDIELKATPEKLDGTWSGGGGSGTTGYESLIRKRLDAALLPNIFVRRHSPR